MDFLLLCMNQLINIAAKARYMYGGAVKAPPVVRSMIGKSWGQGAQLFQAQHPMFMHVPGLKVVAPTTCPPSPALEAAFYPNPGTVAATAHALVRPDAPVWTSDPERTKLTRQTQFRGPF